VRSDGSLSETPSTATSRSPSQVKSEFKDNDDVYNKFLEIMKSFKAQS
jgi:hypothetical protein